VVLLIAAFINQTSCLWSGAIGNIGVEALKQAIVKLPFDLLPKECAAEHFEELHTANNLWQTLLAIPWQFYTNRRTPREEK